MLGGNEMKEKFIYTNILLKEYLKRDWKIIVAWVLGIGIFAGGFVEAFVEIGKGQGLAGMFETMKNPAMIAMIGPTLVKDVSDYTIGAMYSHEMLLLSGICAMIAAIFVVNHTRKEEENGLLEFICSYRVGRLANSLAIMIEVVLINIVLMIFIGSLMACFNEPSITLAPAFLFGASICLAGIMGGAIALLMAQIMPSATSATASSLSIVGLLYVLRAGSDMYNVDLSMFNPMGWTYLTFPFTKNNLTPLICGFIFCSILICLAFRLENNRDMSASYLSEREKQKPIKQSLLSVTGLFMRLNRTVIISWLIVFVFMGCAYGSVYSEMQTFLESNELIKMMFTIDGISIEESFSATIMIVMSGLVTILPVVVINKLFNEETSGHLSQLYATKVSRKEVYMTIVTIALITGFIGILLVAVSLGGTALAVLNNSAMNLTDFMMIGINYLPAIIFISALSAFMLGWFPKYGKALYVYVVFSLVISYFKQILNLPELFEKLSIFNWFPKMPIESFDIVIFIVVTIIAIIMIIIGYWGYQKRDLIENA